MLVSLKLHQLIVEIMDSPSSRLRVQKNTNSPFEHKLRLVVEDSLFARSTGNNVNMNIKWSACNYTVDVSAITSYGAHKNGLVFEHLSQCERNQKPELLVTDSIIQEKGESGLYLEWKALPMELFC